MSTARRSVIAAVLLALILCGCAQAGVAASGGGSRVVCLDPGHGGEDSGANYNDLMEKVPNLEIALRTRAILESLGYTVIMTRETDQTVSLARRCEIANRSRAEVFVSIHNNAYLTTSEGTETFCYYDSFEGRYLAKCIHSEVVKRIKLPDRGVKEAGFYVLRNTDMPAALLEGAFITNSREAKLLKSPAFLQKIAEGVAAGIQTYMIDPGLFDEYILLMNPDPEEEAEVDVDLMLGDGRKKTYEEVVPPRTRRTIYVDKLAFNSDVSTRIRSTNGVPVVAERAQYFSFERGRGGHGAPGVAAPSTRWFMAEGSTGWGFSTFILVQNPGDVENKVTLRFMRSDAYNTRKTFTLEPHSRFTLDCKTVSGFKEADFSVTLQSTAPVVTERAMYWNDQRGKTGGHVSPAAATPGRNWHLAEGYTGGEFDTFLLLQNPNGATASVTVNYLLPDGSAHVKRYGIKPNARRTVHVDEVPGLEATDVSFSIQSDLPVVAERSMYFKYDGIAEGSNSLGASTLSDSWYLAEGYTGGGFRTFILLMNPNPRDTGALLRFVREDGTEKKLPVLVKANSRLTVKVNDVSGMSGVAFATMVTSGEPLVVERAKYYSYGDKSGGDSALGVPAPALAWYFAEGCTR